MTFDISHDFEYFDDNETVIVKDADGSNAVNDVTGKFHAITRQGMAMAGAIELQADDSECELFVATLGGRTVRKGDLILRGTAGSEGTWWIVAASLKGWETRWDCIVRRQQGT